MRIFSFIVGRVTRGPRGLRRLRRQRGSSSLSSLSFLPSRRRPGVTLLELLLFMGMLAIIGSMVVPLLFSAAENRSLQETAALVEQSGMQLMQTLTTRIRQAEIILDPPPGGSGAVLALQTGSGGANPTIFGFSTGSLAIIRSTTRQQLSTAQVSVDALNFRNTSTSTKNQSVLVTFQLSRSIRLQQPRTYTQVFETVVSLFPDDRPIGAACNCATPGCGSGNQYLWETCVAGSCILADSQLKCP